MISVGIFSLVRPNLFFFNNHPICVSEMVVLLLLNSARESTEFKSIALFTSEKEYFKIKIFLNKICKEISQSMLNVYQFHHELVEIKKYACVTRASI